MPYGFLNKSSCNEKKKRHVISAAGSLQLVLVVCPASLVQALAPEVVLCDAS
jgi:hypothetical protein